MLNIIFILTLINTCILLILLSQKQKNDNAQTTIDKKELERLTYLGRNR